MNANIVKPIKKSRVRSVKDRYKSYTQQANCNPAKVQHNNPASYINLLHTSCALKQLDKLS